MVHKCSSTDAVHQQGGGRPRGHAVHVSGFFSTRRFLLRVSTWSSHGFCLDDGNEDLGDDAD